MGRDVRVAVAQLYSKPGDKDYNLLKIKEYTRKAAQKGANFICFPELYYGGYDLPKEEMISSAEKQDGRLFQELSQLASENNIYMICGYAEKADINDSIYISVMLVDNKGNLIGNYRKTYLYGEAEKAVAIPGDKYEVFETKFGTVGILVCYDMEFPEPARILAFKGAEIIFIPAAFVNVHWMTRYLSAIAIQNQVYIVGSNHAGNKKGGNSKVISPLGGLMTEASMTGDELLITELDLDSDVSKVHPHFNDFKPETIKQCIKAYEENSEIIKNKYKNDNEAWDKTERN